MKSKMWFKPKCNTDGLGTPRVPLKERILKAREDLKATRFSSYKDVFGKKEK